MHISCKSNVDTVDKNNECMPHIEDNNRVEMALVPPEWVNDFYDEEYYTNSPWINLQEPSLGENRLVRKNSYNSHYSEFSEAYYRTRGYPALGNSDRGFSCAADFAG